MQVLHVVGARPNFMKVAPVMRALSGKPVRQLLVHTGQHYDAAMSDIFFTQLGLPPPDVNLNVGSGSHAQQTASIMLALERVLLDTKPDLLMVYGDVNSTLSAAVVAVKLCIPVAHVEAGLRSFDLSMPEEVNRLVADRLSTWLFTPSADADKNLLKEGTDPAKIHLVGNVMIDTLVRLLPASEGHRPAGTPEDYLLVTLHRAANVDDLSWLQDMFRELSDLSKDVSVVFPVHPRTRQRMKEAGVLPSDDGRLVLLDPVPYLEFLHLQRHARAVITDSGGIQEETTYLGVPCITVRDNTERPITVTLGTNVIVGRNASAARAEAQKCLSGKRKPATIPPLWDGRAGERIADIICGIHKGL